MENQLSASSVVTVSGSQVSSQFMDEETVILDVQEGAYYVLNPVGARIWELIATPKRVEEVIDTLMDEYEVEKDQCTREVMELLQDLAGQGLVEIQNEAD